MLQLTRLLPVMLLAGLLLGQYPAKMRQKPVIAVDPGGGAPPVQSGTSGGTGGTLSNTQPFTTPVVAGDFLVLHVMDATDLTTTVSSVGWAGGSGNCGAISPTPASPVNNATRRMWVYTAAVVTGGCTGVVFNFSAAINSIVIYSEYAGIAGIDVEKAGTGTAAAMTSGTVATTNPYDLLVGGFFVTSAGGGSVTAGAGYTIRVNSASTRITEDQNVAALGSYAATATYSSSQTYIAHLLALKRGTLAPVVSKNYYLAPAADGGNDGNTGLSAASPWLTPNHSLSCGDTITAKASTAYSAANFDAPKWGAVNCPSKDNVAWLKCEFFNACKITATNTYAMNVGNSYWGIQGWETSGIGNYAACFAIQPTNGIPIHHVIFANNVARGCANGIATSNQYQNATVGVDYIVVVGNISWNASQSTVLCNSGITIYEPVKSDSLPGTHIYIAGNFTMDNYTPTGCISPGVTYDGNGIVIDDAGGVQTGIAPYDQQIVVENNISVWNGGFGLANSGNGTTAAPITYRQNTSAYNLTATNTSTTTCGDMTLMASYLSTFTRNLVVTKAGTGCAGGTGTIYATAVNEGNGTSFIFDNWLYSAAGNNNTVIASPGFVLGTNTVNTNPLLANPVDPGAPNCGGKASVPDCMATVIANYTPGNAAAKAYGYQPVAAPDTVKDPLFPQWLCNTNLPAGLIALHCPPTTPPTIISFNFTTGVMPNAITFTRPSIGTYTNSSGILTTAGANVPRFNSVGGTPHLLVEPAGTNILLWSNTLNSTSWYTINGGIVTANQFVSPDGTNNGWALNAGAGGYGADGQYLALVTNVPHTLSAWAKRITGTAPHMFMFGGINGGDKATSTTITRLFSTITPAAGSAEAYFFTNGPAGNTNGMFGLQAEVGSKMTSYIPTAATTITRLADSVAFTIPAGVTQLTYTFDDSSTQVVAVTPGAYTVPTNLNRPNIKAIQSPGGVR